MRLLLLAAAGGAIGAGARHLINVVFGRLLISPFPWHTVLVNVAGSFAMGILVAVLAFKISGSTEIRTFFATGVLGGFTTFSAFSLDFATLVERGQTMPAMAYVAASVVMSIAALFAGMWAGRTLLA